MLIAVHGVLQVIYTTLLKVYVKGGLFEKSKELLKELEALGYAEDEVHFFFLGYHFFKIFPKILFCILINSIFCEVYWRRAINLYRKRISFEALYYIDSWLFLSVIGVNTKRVWYSFVSLNSIMHTLSMVHIFRIFSTWSCSLETYQQSIELVSRENMVKSRWWQKIKFWRTKGMGEIPWQKPSLICLTWWLIEGSIADCWDRRSWNCQFTKEH